jgi:hypothetical protein
VLVSGGGPGQPSHEQAAARGEPAEEGRHPRTPVVEEDTLRGSWTGQAPRSAAVPMVVMPAVIVPVVVIGGPDSP